MLCKRYQIEVARFFRFRPRLTYVAYVFVAVLFLCVLSRWLSAESRKPRPGVPCKPRKNIVFIKTHKCASSSVQNVILRYARRNNLTVVLPILSDTHYLSRLLPFNRKMIAGAPWGHKEYNVFCHHAIFNEEEISAIMPKDTVYVSILREPTRLFESLYEYTNMNDFYNMTLAEYAIATRDAANYEILNRRAHGNMGRNQMLFDFGVNPFLFENKTEIQKAIVKIERKFDLIMIAEYFDQSIVLLKDLMCWDIDDVVSLKVNAREDRFKNSLTPETADLLRRWNMGDQMLYNTFVEKFKSKIAAYGLEEMEKDVQQLREKSKYWHNACIAEEVETKRLTRYHIWSNKVLGFVLKQGIQNQTCEDLARPEREFTKYMRQQQLMRALFTNDHKLEVPLPDLFNLNTNETKIILHVLRDMVKNKVQFLPVAVKGPVDITG
ncbi:galactose-3-O-sulfotransferase 2-like [Tachypleus tridentatus]|uniref:galactose-3-O-sulfotransferase 2-like n=1 Tax=Tachypleus tridentatus TaxID=6853 RepID=UPI003FD28D87